jgi:DNA-binding transcriptional ArsR family regulator
MKETAALFRLLGDEVRLRILRLLDRERLNVSELTSVLGIAQPGVSRHLRLLREGGLVEEERDRGWAYYGLRRGEGASALFRELLQR